MTFEELKQNQELLAACRQEIAEKVNAGQNAAEAKTAVLKAHGVEVDEDAEHAEAVGKMELSDEELDKVAGGSGACWKNYACSFINKPDRGMPGEPCWYDLECFALNDCVLAGMTE